MKGVRRVLRGIPGEKQWSYCISRHLSASTKNECEVSRFWNKVRQMCKYAEIVKDWNQKWAGICVLYVSHGSNRVLY